MLRSSFKNQVKISIPGESRCYRRTYDCIHTESSFVSSLRMRTRLHPKILTGSCTHNVFRRGERRQDVEGYERCNMRSDKIDVQGEANERNLFARDTVKTVALCNRSRAPVRTPVYKKYFPHYFCGWKHVVAYNNSFN